MKEPSELSRIAFPQCSINCSTVRRRGPGDCTDVCARKFVKLEGGPAAYRDLSQRELDNLLAADRPRTKQ